MRRYLNECNQSSVFGTVPHFTDCRPGVTFVALFGHYMVSTQATLEMARNSVPSSHALSAPLFVCVRASGCWQYNTQVSIGGFACPSYGLGSDRDRATFIYCTAPVWDYDPATAYDLVLSNEAGIKVTLPGLVQYTSAPTVYGIAPCIDRGEWYVVGISVAQCPAGSTITLLGSRFPVGGAVTVQYVLASSGVVDLLLNAVVLNSTAVTATLPASPAADNRMGGRVKAQFNSNAGSVTSNALFEDLYLSSYAPTITSVSSASCDSLSPLQLTNCRAMAVITVTGSNLQLRNGVFFATSTPAGELLAYDFLLPSNSSIVSLSNTSLVFTLDYFDADTNVQLQPNVVYSNIAIAEAGVYDSLLTWRYSNAFYLSLTYDTADTNSSSKRLSSGAVAGIVIAAVAVALLLVAAVAWLVRRQLSSKSAGGGGGWSSHSDAQGSSDEYKDVELN